MLEAINLRDIGSIINTGKARRVPLGAEERKAICQQSVKVLT